MSLIAVTAATDAVRLLRVLNVLASAGLAGMLVWEAVIILPLVRTLPASEGVVALRFAGARAWRIAPVLGAVSGTSALAILALWPWGHVTAGAELTLVGIAALVTAVGITLGPYLESDKAIRSAGWTDGPGRAAAFRRSERIHWLRTVFWVLSAVAFAGAAVASAPT